MVSASRLDAWLTWILSLISLSGSILILVSWFIAYNKVGATSKDSGAPSSPRPRDAEANVRGPTRSRSFTRKSIKNKASGSILIRNLALYDFVWFFSAFLCGNYWLFSETGHVPDILCGIVSPLIVYCRLCSLLWSCVITYDVYRKVCKRGLQGLSTPSTGSAQRGKSLFPSDDSEEKQPSQMDLIWHSVKIMLWRYKYGICVNVIAVPTVGLLTSGNVYGYCEPGFESVGAWETTLTLLILPIALGIAIQLFVYFKVREKMNLKAYPQSVRKRRRRIMYHYILVSALCWLPTLILYVSESAGARVIELDVLSRATLFSSGFFNFLVYGMHDPILIRAFRLALAAVGCSCLLSKEPSPLSSKDHTRIVMFNEKSIAPNADISKDKREMILKHRLSRDEKAALYRDRPDLDPSLVDLPTATRRSARNNQMSSDSDSLRAPLLSTGHDSDMTFSTVEGTSNQLESAFDESMLTCEDDTTREPSVEFTEDYDEDSSSSSDSDHDDFLIVGAMGDGSSA